MASKRSYRAEYSHDIVHCEKEIQAEVVHNFTTVGTATAQQHISLTTSEFSLAGGGSESARF
jgi:hypothetical protein